jgi:hypothetical protein
MTQHARWRDPRDRPLPGSWRERAELEDELEADAAAELEAELEDRPRLRYGPGDDPPESP